MTEPHPQQKYIPSPQIDELITRAYRSKSYGTRRSSLKAIQKFTGWPRHAVYKRALKIGAFHKCKKEAQWTPEEDELLAKNAHKDARVIAEIFGKHGFYRTAGGISMRRKRTCGNFYDTRLDAGVFTSYTLAPCLGVHDRTIRLWIEKGYLAAKQNKTGHFEITDGSVKLFIMENVGMLDFHKIDKFWLVDMLGKPVRRNAIQLRPTPQKTDYNDSE